MHFVFELLIHALAVFDKYHQQQKVVQDLVDKEDYDGATKLADKVLNMHKETLQFFGRVYDKKALALNKQDRPLQALKYNDMAVTLYYDDILCHGNRSYTLERLGRFEEAVEEADIAISLYPNLEKNKYITEKTQKNAYVNALNNKGYYLYKLGKPEEGLKFVEEFWGEYKPHSGTPDVRYESD